MSLHDSTRLASGGLVFESRTRLWVIKYGSTWTRTIRYPLVGCVRDLSSAERRQFELEHVGRELDEKGAEIMLRRALGLTSLYNLVHDPAVIDDPDVDRMRHIHVEVDEATMAAYGWEDVPLDHGFHTYSADGAVDRVSRRRAWRSLTASLS